ncbi:hypothetical protein [Streptomyces sp. NPDC091027]|uniref:hypothetical protein n=1 Tax=Streptomyces sp. NPDC091027 TaxID=3365971 RepID=UPI00381D27F4
MNDDNTPGVEGDEDDFGQEAEPPQDRGVDSNDLSGFMESIRQTSAWRESINRMVEPVRRHVQ